MTDFPPPQATLLQLFERETKREKVLDGIYREKLLKLRADQTLSAAHVISGTKCSSDQVPDLSTFFNIRLGTLSIIIFIL